jgi:flagellar M-ring protein FliF
MAELSIARKPASPDPVAVWLGRAKPLLLLVGVALAVAAGVTVVLWSRPQPQTALYTGLADADAAAVTDSLRAAGIPVQVGPAPGVVQVPQDRAAEARLHLGRAGVMPQADGMKLLSEPQGFGVSSFMEGARYQHALEQELARTIAGLRPVANARVHLAMPKASAFIRDRAPVTASVVLDLLPGAQLASGQAEAIAHLVASSIPELDVKDVTVVDARGGLLSRLDDDDAAMERHYELARRTEAMLVARVQQLISPLVGRAEVQVMVELDPTEAEQAREIVDPNTVVREEQITRERRTGGGDGVPAGVPGAAANQPPEAGGLGPQNEATEGTAAEATLTTAERRAYEVSRELQYTRNRGHRIERVTVAVLLDRPAAVATSPEVSADGTVATTPAWDERTLADVEALVRDAVGYSAERGDRVTVRQGAMQVETFEPLAAAPWWQADWVMRSAKEGLGVAALALIAWLLVRPLINNLMRPMPVHGEIVASREQQAQFQEDSFNASHELANTLSRPGLSLDDKLMLARQAVSEDSKRVAQVVKTWVGSDA